MRLSSLIRAFISTGSVEPALHDQSTFYKYFKQDIDTSSKRIIVESPFLTVRRTNDLLPYLTRAIQRGVAVRVNTRDINDQEGRMYSETSRSIQLLADAGVVAQLISSIFLLLLKELPDDF